MQRWEVEATHAVGEILLHLCNAHVHQAFAWIDGGHDKSLTGRCL